MTEPSFRMPPLPAGQWLDADGGEIAYGRRWGIAGPPEDAYSRVSHPERYAPLHAVGDALVAHLQAAYDCTAEAAATEPGNVRAVLVRPARASADAPEPAGIRIAWTDFPGVRARLGGEVDDAAPICGCDACDESLEDAARQLCDRVLWTVIGSPAVWRRRDV